MKLLFLDYANADTPQPWHAGVGYFCILVVNALLLLPGSNILLTSISGRVDPYERFLAFIIGVPLLGVQLICGAWPAWLYLKRYRDIMMKPHKAILLAMITLPEIALLLGLIVFYFRN